MNRINLQDTAWYQAITLTERIALLRASQCGAMQDQINTDLAERHMRRWRSQTPFTNNIYFDKRLKMDHLTEDEFFYLLGEPIESVYGRSLTHPSWLADLQTAFARPPSCDPMPIPERFHKRKIIGFLNIIGPLIRQGCDCLHDELGALLQTHSNLPFDPNTVESVLFVNLLGWLILMLSRTLVLELRVAGLQGELRGETPEERFHNFIELLRQREVALAILKEYPVLARQLVIWIKQWIDFSMEFLHHLCTDWDQIRATFCPEFDPGLLAEINGGAGDRHRDGRTVIIAKFDSGFQVVYKPKSLAVETHFQDLLRWINDRSNYPPFRTLKILDRGTYGWIEFVAAQGCKSTKEVWRFYERQGGYLALLYALEATDFHFENLIAAGEHPILVDLESVFHPHVFSVDAGQSDMFASNVMAQSVMRIGLLPQRVWANDDSEGVDLSGLGMFSGQLTPRGVPRWNDEGTDKMQFVRERREIPVGQNRPRLNGEDVNVLDYVEAIVAGFTKIYRLLLEHRDELLANDGPLLRFAGDEVRAILRPTQTYALLLQEGFHPNMLRNAMDRERLLDRLWVGLENQPSLEKVIPFEREALWRNDIPMFTTNPNSRHLRSSEGKCIPDFFNESGLDLAKQRLKKINEEDLSQQLWFIRASLTALAIGEDPVQKTIYQPGRPEVMELQTPADREHLLSSACAVGDRLESLAFRREHNASWLGVNLANVRYWSLMPLNMDLYCGLPGIVLFLGNLGKITRQKHYTVLAQDALRTLHNQIKKAQSSIKLIGGFTGWGGVIYTLAHLGILWDQPDLLGEAETLVEQLPDLIEQDEVFDIIDGAAGCIGGLLSLYRCTQSKYTLSAAIQCGDHLIANAQTMKQGVGWISKSSGLRPLTGFSHGAAGIAWALLELSSLTGEERFRSAALDAITYERHLFSPEVGNWPDLRRINTSDQKTKKGQKAERFMTAWCHGAPGIGMARLHALKHLNGDDPELHTEIGIALKTTLTAGFTQNNHSLCHGSLGSLDFLLQASQTLNDSQLKHRVYYIAATILKNIEEHGWLCGIPLRVETPGLMVGLAGIGYELLRLAEPARVPSILTLSSPVQ